MEERPMCIFGSVSILSLAFNNISNYFRDERYTINNRFGLITSHPIYKYAIQYLYYENVLAMALSMDCTMMIVMMMIGA